MDPPSARRERFARTELRGGAALLEQRRELGVEAGDLGLDVVETGQELGLKHRTLLLRLHPTPLLRC